MIDFEQGFGGSYFRSVSFEAVERQPSALKNLSLKMKSSLAQAGTSVNTIGKTPLSVFKSVREKEYLSKQLVLDNN